MNVLFIITDQQRADHLSCAGNPDVNTPNIDNLAKESVRFRRCYCANPICMPNRASIFTGKYPSIHGVRCNGTNLNPEIPTFTETLRKQGYHTTSIGKIHLNGMTPPFSRKYKSVEPFITWAFSPKDKRPIIPKPYFGLDEIDLVLGHGDAVAGHYLDWIEEKAPELHEPLKNRVHKLFEKLYFDTPVPEELYQTSYITQKVISFLERFAKGDYGDKPFFLHCAYPDPHHPLCPPGKYKDMYQPESLTLPPSFNHDLEKHEIYGSFLKDSFKLPTHFRKTTEKEARIFLALTYGAISMIDDGIGQILSALASLNLDKDTMVIFTSDHGDMAADHGVILKQTIHYQGVLKVPLIWKVPNLTKSGVSTDSLASSIDIPLTILNLLNIKSDFHPQGMQGHDLTPILKDPEKEIRDNCIIEEDDDFQTSKGSFRPPIRIRTMISDNYRISVFQGPENGGELIDLKNDPNELLNLWNDKNYVDIKHELLSKMLTEIIVLQNRYPKPQSNA